MRKRSAAAARSSVPAIAVSLALIPAGALAVIETGAIVLHDPLSARSAAMGETGVADNTDPANIYFNPANVIGTPRAYINGAYWKPVPDLSDDVWFGRASAGLRFDTGDNLSFGGDITYGRLDYGESIATTPGGAPLGVYDTYEHYLGLTAGVGVLFSSDWELRVGGSAKRFSAHYSPADVSSQPDPVDLDGFAFDLGSTFARRFDIGEWSATPGLAIAYVNFGGDIENDDIDDPLPTRMHFGSSMRAESPTTRILGAEVPVLAMAYNLEATDRMHGDDFSWGIGGELAVAQIFFLRAGTSDINDEDDESVFDDVGEFESVSGWGVGVGVPVGSLRTRFDYTKVGNSFTEKKLGFSIDWIF